MAEIGPTGEPPLPRTPIADDKGGLCAQLSARNGFVLLEFGTQSDALLCAAFCAGTLIKLFGKVE